MFLFDKNTKLYITYVPQRDDHSKNLNVHNNGMHWLYVVEYNPCCLGSLDKLCLNKLNKADKILNATYNIQNI